MSSDIEHNRSDDDNVADHEPGLFNDDDDDRDGDIIARFGEGEAEEAVEVPGSTQMNVTANLEMPGADEKKKRVIKNPQPKLNAERIMGPRGIQSLEAIFKDWTPKGPGHEFDDLDVVMYRLNHWTHRLYPKLPFDETLNIIANRLGNKKVVTTHLKKIRMGMINPSTLRDPDEIPEEVDVAQYDLANMQMNERGEDDEPERYGDGEAATASQQISTERAEQLERMRRNKEIALQKRREREEMRRKAMEEDRRREEEEEEIMRDMEEESRNQSVENTNPTTNKSPSFEKEKNSPGNPTEKSDSEPVSPEKEKNSTSPFKKSANEIVSPEKEKNPQNVSPQKPADTPVVVPMEDSEDIALDWTEGEAPKGDANVLSLDQMMEEMEEDES